MTRRRGLSHDEDALWRKVTRDVRPIKRKSAPKTAASRAAETPRDGPPARVRSAPPPAPASKRVSKGRRTPALQSGDPALDKKARRGRIEIERTVDLHGLREAPARTRLRSFVEAAARDGCRCVLVVTGKGKPEADPSEDRPRGIIRKRFVEWIDEEPLRSLVTRASTAQPRHGGTGAFYVFLKARR